MSEPLLMSTIRKHPDWHVSVSDPTRSASGRAGAGTTARTFALEMDQFRLMLVAGAFEDAADAAREAGITQISPDDLILIARRLRAKVKV